MLLKTDPVGLACPAVFQKRGKVENKRCQRGFSFDAQRQHGELKIRKCSFISVADFCSLGMLLKTDPVGLEA